MHGATWNTEMVEGGWVMHNSLILDTAGCPHISYAHWDQGVLKYAHFDGNVWQVETVDSAEDLGNFTSLALDTAGRPHISYYGVGRVLKYAHFDGSAWQVETVDSTGDVGQYASLALDAAGQPHIGYQDQSTGDLKYARRADAYLVLLPIVRKLDSVPQK